MTSSCAWANGSDTSASSIDRGRGIAAVTDDDPHFGLRLLRTRVHEIDGSLEMISESAPRSWTLAMTSLPGPACRALTPP